MRNLTGFCLKIKLLIASIFMCVSLSGGTAVFASSGQFDIIEVIPKLKLTLDKEKLEGFVLYNICRWNQINKVSTCKVERLLITSQTRAFANNKQVELKKVKQRLGRSASIVYYADSLIIENISWYD